MKTNRNNPIKIEKIKCSQCKNLAIAFSHGKSFCKGCLKIEFNRRGIKLND